jgi:hypothetical protein
MKTFKLLFFVSTFILFLNGCNNNHNNPYNPPGVEVPIDNPPVVNPPAAGNTEYYDNVIAAFNQTEDDEPLEVTDTVDETSNFNALL